MTSSKFVDLGAGMFLCEQTVGDETWVCDSRCASSDVQFEPASWDGEHGPVSGHHILSALPTRIGGWDQISEECWAWCMPDGRDLDEPPSSWPRKVNVLDGPHAVAFAGLAGADARLVAAQLAHPHIFGEPHMASGEAH